MLLPALFLKPKPDRDPLETADSDPGIRSHQDGRNPAGLPFVQHEDWRFQQIRHNHNYFLLNCEHLAQQCRLCLDRRSQRALFSSRCHDLPLNAFLPEYMPPMPISSGNQEFVQDKIN